MISFVWGYRHGRADCMPTLWVSFRVWLRLELVVRLRLEPLFRLRLELLPFRQKAVSPKTSFPKHLIPFITRPLLVLATLLSCPAVSWPRTLYHHPHPLGRSERPVRYRQTKGLSGCQFGMLASCRVIISAGQGDSTLNKPVYKKILN
jgi:hypothetical protein